MTKTEMAHELAQIQIESMDYGDIVSLAFEHVKQNLAKLSKDELEDQYEYAFGTIDQ
jgi:nucleoid DNA-binding protein